jgi:hypothetical protein
MYDPEKDGVTHINVYSKGRTLLGQMLTNFARTPFKHPVHGHFASMEGYWYWIKSGGIHDHMKRLYGHSAKSAGIKLPIIHRTDFKELIIEGIRCKLLQNPDILAELKKNTLPLAHYYVYGTTTYKVVEKPEQQWQLDAIEAVRKEVCNDPN